MKNGKRIAVIGSGSWATAIVKIICNNAGTVSWFFRNQSDIEHMTKYGHNPRYLSSVQFDSEKLDLSSNLLEIIKNADIIILAVPSAFIHNTLKDVPPEMFRDKMIFSAIKGIVPEFNLIVGEYLNSFFDILLDHIGVITGPCHAEEVALEKLSYLTLACRDIEKADELCEYMRCRYIKCSSSDDIYGTELSAVLKNVVAVAGGICHGLGYGDNFLSVLVSNAIQEIDRFVAAVHPIDRDTKASAYLGDLLVTAYSQFSRNRMFGTMLGKGYSVRQAQLEMNMVAEGYYAVKCVVEINKKYEVHMPITNAVNNIIYNHKDARTEMADLAEQLS
ncbi:MAG: glycerol-3-phosphate dehydrogenase [Bacteroidota bacterium]|jgi:glycerol-3-phosphate dehydrogenase (NAD(P)+)|nr:glycerol-3-phosphate dehydrogenase [Bacteroidota bacterium]